MNAIADELTPRRGVGSQAVLLAGATGVAQVIVAILYLLGARSTSPEEFGYVVAAIALGSTAVGFLDFGTNSLWVRELARGQLTREELGARLINKVLVVSGLTAAWSVATALVLPNSSYWMAGPVCLALVLNQTSQVPLRGMARGELVSWSILLDRVAAGALLALLVLAGWNAAEALWVCLTLGSLTAALVGWLMTPKDYRPVLRFHFRSNPWKGAGYFGLNSLAVSAQGLDLPIIAASGGPLAAGLFGAVNRWTQPMGLLAGAFASASAPFVARSPSWGSAWNHLKKGIWLPLLAIAVCLIVAFLAPWLVIFLIGEDYANSGLVLQILALGTIPAIVNQPLSVFLQSMGFDRPVSIVMVASVLVQLALVGFLAAQLGAMGAALAFALLQVLVLTGLTVVAVSVRSR